MTDSDYFASAVDEQIINRAAKMLADNIAHDPLFIKRLTNSCRIEVREHEIVGKMLSDAKTELEQTLRQIKDEAKTRATANLNAWVFGYFESKVQSVKDQIKNTLDEESIKTMIAKSLDDVVRHLMYTDFKTFLDKFRVTVSLGELLQKHSDAIRADDFDNS